jgi:hypothetical protein
MSVRERLPRAQTIPRPQTFVRPPYKRQLSTDSLASRTEARLIARQAFAATVPGDGDEVDVAQSQKKGERKPIITASALTM